MDHLKTLTRLGQRFQGVNLKFRRDGTEWPKKWLAECFSAKHEGARHQAFGDTAEDAIEALAAMVKIGMLDE